MSEAGQVLKQSLKHAGRWCIQSPILQNKYTRMINPLSAQFCSFRLFVRCAAGATFGPQLAERETWLAASYQCTTRRPMASQGPERFSANQKAGQSFLPSRWVGQGKKTVHVASRQPCQASWQRPLQPKDSDPEAMPDQNSKAGSTKRIICGGFKLKRILHVAG